VAAVTARGLSPTERLWLAADEVARATAATPFVIEVYAVGTGAPDPAALETASEGLVRTWPLAGARLERGQWRQHHARLPVRVVDAPTGWRGDSTPLDPDSLNTLSPERGPLVEAVVIRGTCSAWIVRAHHALLDGRAVVELAQDWARLARGESARGPGEAALPELPRQYGRRTQSERTSVPAALVADAPAPTMWVRATLPRPPRDVTCTALVALTRALRAHQPALQAARLRASLPVDLRPGTPAGQSNMTGFVRLELDPATRVEALRAELNARRPDAAQWLGEVSSAGWLPRWLLRRLVRTAGARVRKTHRADESLTFSNLGRLPPGALRVPGLMPTAAFVPPPAQAGAPLFATLTGADDTIHLCVGAADRPGLHEALVKILRDTAAYWTPTEK